MTDKRVRKPEAERDEPIRSWAGMFEGSAEARAGAEERARPFEQDVTMGYRVIEEFMRRGAAAARDVSQQFLNAPDPRANAAMLERLFQSATDFGSVWMEMMQALWFAQAEAPRRQDPGPFVVRQSPVARAVPDPAPPSSEPAAQPDAERPPARPTVAFRVQSPRAVEVSATLDPKLGPGPFVVHDLRALDPSLPSIPSVRFEYEPERAHALATLEVGASHAPAIYTGLIVDAQTQLPAGSITVRVL